MSSGELYLHVKIVTLVMYSNTWSAEITPVGELALLSRACKEEVGKAQQLL